MKNKTSISKFGDGENFREVSSCKMFDSFSLKIVGGKCGHPFYLVFTVGWI